MGGKVRILIKAGIFPLLAVLLIAFVNEIPNTKAFNGSIQCTLYPVYDSVMLYRLSVAVEHEE